MAGKKEAKYPTKGGGGGGNKVAPSVGKYPKGEIDMHKQLATGDNTVGFKKGGKAKKSGGKC